MKDENHIPGKSAGLIYSQNSPLKEIVDRATILARTRVPIFIVGETGTGKELIANFIRANSLDGFSRPMVAVNCGAIPETLIESELFGYEKGAFTGANKEKDGYLKRAGKGILFLDEIEELPLKVQVELLRALDGKFFRIGGNDEIEFNARVVAATNVPPEELIKCGKLREDFYYRLRGGIIFLPPLRDRPIEDFNLLVENIINQGARENNLDSVTVANDAMRVFCEYSWPGNVREMKNLVVEAMIVALGRGASEIELQDLPVELKLSIPVRPPILNDFAAVSSNLCVVSPSSGEMQALESKLQALIETGNPPERQELVGMRKEFLRLFFGEPYALTSIIEYLRGRFNLENNGREQKVRRALDRGLTDVHIFSPDAREVLTFFLHTVLRQPPGVIESFHTSLALYNEYVQKFWSAKNSLFHKRRMQHTLHRPSSQDSAVVIPLTGKSDKGGPKAPKM